MGTHALNKNKIFKIFAFCLALLTSLLCLFGCSRVSGVVYIGNYFGADLVLYLNSEKNSKQIDEIVEKSNAVLTTVENMLSTENENSEIYAFNSLEEGKSVEVSKTVYDLIYYAKDLNEKTQGYFSPAIYYLLDLYGFTKRHQENALVTFPYDRQWQNGVYPNANEEYVEGFKSLADFSKVSAYELDGKFYLKKDCPSVTILGETYSQKIDLSSVAKGYALDKINEIIKSYGLTEYYLSFGTSSIYLGENGGKAWPLEIVDPNSENRSSLLKINLQNKSVSTSGAYENAYQLEGVFYHHIIDPITGYPSQSDVLLALVAGDNSMVLDALSTTVVALGLDEGIKFLSSSEEKYSFVIVTRDNKIYTNVSSVSVLVDGYALETIC